MHGTAVIDQPASFGEPVLLMAGADGGHRQGEQHQGWRHLPAATTEEQPAADEAGRPGTPAYDS
jgi:hypothetical protein